MKNKLYKTGIASGILLGTIMIVYAITSFFFTHSVTSNLSKKTVFQFDLTTDMVATEVGPGDYFDVKPVIYNDATEDMYVFIQVDMPTIGDRTLYSFNVDSDWSPVSINGGTVVYAYAGSEMTTLQPGDYTSALTEKMTMNDISYAEYAVIDDINVMITGYAIGTKEISMEPVEAWNQCKGIEESL